MFILLSDGYGSRNTPTNPFDDNQTEKFSENQFANHSSNQFKHKSTNQSTNQSSFQENNHFQSHSETSFNNNRPFQFNHKRQTQSYMDMNQHQQPVLLRDPSNLRASSGKAGNRQHKFKNFTGFAQIYADNLFEDFFKE